MANYAKAKLHCDIVMKGGITSGVVYPGAVIELAKAYRFKSIGGTSAGAIAAAVVAAGEYNRDRGGFDKVASLPATIAGEIDGDPFVLRLFQPDDATRPLFRVAIGFLRHGVFRGTLTALAKFWHFPLVALAVAAAAICLTVFAGGHAAFAVAGVAAAIWILLVGLIGEILRAISAIADNDFGLCRLGPPAGDKALTGWLHEELQTISGKGDRGPLTFADLWGVSELQGNASDAERKQRDAQLIERSRNPASRTIDLLMMTTNLTHGRPVRLPIPIQPYRDKSEEGGGLLFRPDQLANFFPDTVVEHLKTHAKPLSTETHEHLNREAPDMEFHHFPVGGELPVLVATRMSLSFPVLISTIPLWELDYQMNPKQPPLKRVVFSDGGISSNFPVHFFDSPLPTRPTFGLHLAGFAPGETPDPDDPCGSVRDPTDVAGQEPEAWVEFQRMFGFLVAIKDAMQNWRDNAQSRLPGFRDRIVHIKLAQGEGGLNLAMASDKVSELTKRGQCAGEILVELFAGDVDNPQPTERWNDHRFARYRTTMSALERFLRSYQQGYTSEPDAVTLRYGDRIQSGEFDGHYAFNSRELFEFAELTTAKYVELVDYWRRTQETLDDRNVPRPSSTLRMIPPV